MIVSTVVIVEAVLVLTLGWLFYVQHLREKKLIEIANNCVDNFEQISDIIKKADETLSSSSVKAAFESDDETGIFFKQLEEIQSILNNFKLEPDGKEEVTE